MTRRRTHFGLEAQREAMEQMGLGGGESDDPR